MTSCIKYTLSILTIITLLTGCSTTNPYLSLTTKSEKKEIAKEDDKKIEIIKDIIIINSPTIHTMNILNKEVCGTLESSKLITLNRIKEQNEKDYKNIQLISVFKNDKNIFSIKYCKSDEKNMDLTISHMGYNKHNNTLFVKNSKILELQKHNTHYLEDIKLTWTTDNYTF